MSDKTRYDTRNDIASFTLTGLQQYDAFKQALVDGFAQRGIDTVEQRDPQAKKIIARNGFHLLQSNASTDGVYTGYKLSMVHTRSGIMNTEDIADITTASHFATITLHRDNPEFEAVRTAVESAKQSVPLASNHNPDRAFYFLRNARQSAAFVKKLEAHFEALHIPQWTNKDSIPAQGRYYTLRHGQNNTGDGEKYVVTLIDVHHGQTSARSVARMEMHGGHTKLILNRKYDHFLNLATAAHEAIREQAVARTPGHAAAITQQREVEGRPVSFMPGDMSRQAYKWEQDVLHDIPTSEIMTQAQLLRASLNPAMTLEEGVETLHNADYLDQYVKKRHHIATISEDDTLFLNNIKASKDSGFEELIARIEAPAKGNSR